MPSRRRHDCLDTRIRLKRPAIDMRPRSRKAVGPQSADEHITAAGGCQVAGSELVHENEAGRQPWVGFLQQYLRMRDTTDGLYKFAAEVNTR